MIQKHVRAFQTTKHFSLTREQSTKLQALIRRFLAERRAQKLKSAAIVLSSWFRRQIDSKREMERKLVESHRAIASTRIQAQWRSKHLSSRFKQIRSATIALQSKFHLQQSSRTSKPQSDSSLVSGEGSQQGSVVEIKKRIALRKVALPRYRRADHELLDDIDL